MTKHAPRSTPHFGSWILFIAGLFGCERRIAEEAHSPEAERFASKACAASYECGCATRYTSEQECIDSLLTRFSAAQRNLTLDRECFDTFLENPVLTDCALVEEISSTATCTMLRGDKREGESCSPHYELFSLPGLINECEDGAFCLAGQCTRTPMAAGKAAGNSCNSNDPGSCDPFNGVFCENDGICRNGVGAGEPCTSPFGCFDAEVPLYCQLGGGATGSCVERGMIGSACEPKEYLACFDEGSDGSFGAAWCDVSSRTCVEGYGPVICESVMHPLARPE